MNNTGSLQANESLQVGTASESVVVLNDLVSLPPLTDSEILLIVDPAEGSLVYATKSDVLLVFDGVKWKRLDGQNDSYFIVNDPCTGKFEDIEGNFFYGVQIGTQCWMDQNLKVTTYPDGTAIPPITDNTAWVNLADDNTDDAYCYYENNASSDYGALYTYAAAIADNWAKDNDDVTNGEGGQGICPDGWHLPTDDDWTILTNYLNSGWVNIVGIKMKEMGTSHWNYPNNGATNESGFTALPGGYRRYYDGKFLNVGYEGDWWSATENSSVSNNALSRALYNNTVAVGRDEYNNKSRGLSVRCLRDDD